MTINKAQGQTLTYCSIDLVNNCLSHGQLYVAFSRVGRPDHLYTFMHYKIKLSMYTIKRF